MYKELLLFFPYDQGSELNHVFNLYWALQLLAFFSHFNYKMGLIIFLTCNCFSFVLQFLDHCTSVLQLPFAARRLFDSKGTEIFSLADIERDQLVYVTCGETWLDPKLTRKEQKRRYELSRLGSDVNKIRQFCALRNPESKFCPSGLSLLNSYYQTHCPFVHCTFLKTLFYTLNPDLRSLNCSFSRVPEGKSNCPTMSF